MAESAAALLRKVCSAQDLQSVVHTMKALAASSIGQYERSVISLLEYFRTVELGLSACFRYGNATTLTTPTGPRSISDTVGAIVFGSDQGLVGQFNDVVTEFAVTALAASSGHVRVWAVGERVCERLADEGIDLAGRYGVPSSVHGIAPLVERIQFDSETLRAREGYATVYIFHNRPRASALYEPVGQRLLPLDTAWRADLVKRRWPTRLCPQIIDGAAASLPALVREYLYISLFKSCAESLASENASRLAAMQRADKNIENLLQELHATFHRVRQSSIDEELFDVLAGYEALSPGPVR